MSDWLVQNYLDRAYDNWPDNVAVSCMGRKMTYRELYHIANRLSQCLKNIGVGRQDRVAFCLNRSERCIVSIFGILKSDAIYTPLDPRLPQYRLEQIIMDCRPRVIICEVNTLEILTKINEAAKTTLLIVDSREDDETAKVKRASVLQHDLPGDDNSECPDYENIDTDVAYILYTSGSTGPPKGSMISHLNISNYIGWAVDCFSITQSDCILGTAPFHFDMSTFDIYCAVKPGATLCIASDADLLFPINLVNLIDRERVTIWKAISSLIMYMAKTGTLKPGRMLSLSRVLFGGEVLATKYLIKWMNTYPEKAFYNVYGPTEATGISTYYQIPTIPKNDATPIPIGLPCANTDVLLLNKSNQLAGIEEIGEMHIRGSSLSKGYWRNPKKTRSEFITNPLTNIVGDIIYKTRDLARIRKDGMYEFIGRADSQIKHMGYRIELQEIENALLMIEEVNDAAVSLINTDLTDISELAAFIECKDKISSSKFQSKLKSILPLHMIPKYIVSITEIPRTNRGKIDRRALRKYSSDFLWSNNNRQPTLNPTTDAQAQCRVINSKPSP